MPGPFEVRALTETRLQRSRRRSRRPPRRRLPRRSHYLDELTRLLEHLTKIAGGAFGQRERGARGPLTLHIRLDPLSSSRRGGARRRSTPGAASPGRPASSPGSAASPGGRRLTRRGARRRAQASSSPGTGCSPNSIATHIGSGSRRAEQRGAVHPSVYLIR
jgi:hypothetical protein